MCFKNLSYKKKYLYKLVLYLIEYSKKIEKIWPIFNTENFFENQNFQTFEKDVDNFDKPDDDIILWEYYFFPLEA